MKGPAFDDVVDFHALCAAARRFARRYAFFLKMDVRKFFETVDHGVMKAACSTPMVVLAPIYRACHPRHALPSASHREMGPH